MELMKEIDKLAQDYTPPVQEDVQTHRMLKSMTPPKDMEKSDKLDLSKKAREKKSLKQTMKAARDKNGWH